MKVNCQASFVCQNTDKQKFGKEISLNRQDNLSDIKNYSLMSYPANYYVSFGARVDKGLNRFYDKNKDLMPETVKEYIGNLSEEEKNGLTPLSAQQNAFEYLSICDNIDDVKDIYPNEPLFSDLKSCFDVKTRQGFLSDVQVIYDDIEQEGGKILSSGEDLTLYIIKKIFLEGKTTREINEDLDNDIHEVLKKDDKNYISPNTCKALGIKFPNNEYLTSLRYTRDGYSDEAARKLVKAWERLSDEEKERRINQLLSSQKNISPEQKERLRKQRSECMKKHWQEMSSAEKTAYIEKLKAGGQEQSIIMVSAWNKCPQVRKDLSMHLREADFHNTEKIIYSDKPLSAAMSIVMTKFWEKYPEHAESLGEAIIRARNEIEDAKENGNYDKYIEETLETSKKIKSEIKAQAKADMNAKQRKKNTKLQINSAEPVSEEESIVKECPVSVAQQMAFVSCCTNEPFFPTEYLVEESQIIAKLVTNPNCDTTMEKNNLRAAHYAVLKSLFSCTDDKSTELFLTFANENNIQEICKEIHNGNMNPVINEYGNDVVLCFSKQPNQDITDETYKRYIKPLTKSELKELKQMKIQEDDLKPQNGFLREMLNDDSGNSVAISMLNKYANQEFLETMFQMYVNPDSFLQEFLNEYNKK